MMMMIYIQNPIYYCKFRHIQAYSPQVLFRQIQPYCGIFKILCNTCIFRTVPYSESWQIQNPRYIQNSVKEYSGLFRTLCNARIQRTLPYSELCGIQNLGIFRTPSIFRILFIKVYSIMIVIITLTFFFHFNLTYFSAKFRKTCFLTTMTLISMLD